MKKEHYITGLVVLGIFIYLMTNDKDDVIDTSKVVEPNKTLSFDGGKIDDSMSDMVNKNVFKSKARLTL